MTLLAIDGLSIAAAAYGPDAPPVIDGISLSVAEGESLGIACQCTLGVVAQRQTHPCGGHSDQGHHHQQLQQRETCG